MVLQGGYVKLKMAFTAAFPGVMYNQQYARHRLLQMPLVCLRIDYRPGVSECILLEFVERCQLQIIFSTAAQCT